MSVEPVMPILPVIPSQSLTSSAASAAASAPGDRPRILSADDARALADRLRRYMQGGGQTGVFLRSYWTGNVRWARNVVSSTGEDEDNVILTLRSINGADAPQVYINETTDAALVAALRKTERLLTLNAEVPDRDVITHATLEPMPDPQLFSEATYQLDAGQRAEHARQLAQSALDAGVLSSGYIEVMARSEALLTSWGVVMYHRLTQARYSVTVRDPKARGSGWAGVDWTDWSKIDGPKLSAIALDKCLKSRNPVAIEPGRYTTILEPQSVCDFLVHFVQDAFGFGNYADPRMPFNKRKGGSLGNNDPGAAMLGEKVMDERISISADPMDPELGFPPFGVSLVDNDPWSLLQTEIYHPATWIKDGVLTNLAYDRARAIFTFGQDVGRPSSGAFRLDVRGPTASVEEMIATTKRGLLVTRFDKVYSLEDKSFLTRGYTRDGLWLIENGKISKPVMNMMFLESPLFALNNVEQLGVPQRAFHPLTRKWWNNPQPVVVPPIKVRDFSFTALSSAI